MTETVESSSMTLGSSAGAMLRAARERQGMHIAMLAAMMKITPGKLEALEADRYDELPDLAFVRALAKTVCRTLKIDSQPVLDKLPSLSRPERLEHTAVGLNTPFREGGGSRSDSQRWQWLRRPAWWATALVLVGALVMAFAPPSWLQRLTGNAGPSATPSAISTPLGKAPSAVVTEVLPGPAGTSAAVPTVSAPASLATTAAVVAAPVRKPDLMGPPRADEAKVAVDTVHAVPSSTSPIAAPVAGVLVIRAKAEAWVDVSDARGRPLVARTLLAGETVGIDGEAPFRLRLGNAPNTEVRFRGETVDLAPRSTGTSARFELK